MPTALEIAQGRNTPLTAGLLMAIQTRTPLLNAFDVRTTRGTRFLSLAVVSLPSSAFSNYGEGFASSEGKLELREFNCNLIGGLVKAEVITAERWDAEHQSAGTTYFDLQTELKFLADAMNVERQMILGTANDAKGFSGARELTPFESGNVFEMTENGAQFDFERSVLDVGGSAANTGSSVYSFVFGEMDAQLVLGGDAGGDGELIQLRPMERQMLAPDPVNAPGSLSLHDVAQMDGHIGLAVSGHNESIEGQSIPTQYSVRRATNITAEAGFTLTDEVLTKLTRSHGTGRRPNLLAMSERSGEQLAASRAPVSIYNMGGGDAALNQANIHPDPPEDWRGIPIVYPQPTVIGDTDAIEA